jgi:[protein-PII] uridylyltransferase
MLCHDLAKGTGGGHAEKGEAIALQIAQRMGLTPAAADLCAWLVKKQELMSEFAFKRNLDEEKTIDDFVARVQSPERLRLLLLLTVSDIRAVGPTIWNGWKGALMRELYARAMAAMGVGAAAAPGENGRTANIHAQWESNPHAPAIEISHDRFRAISEITCCTSYTPTVLRNLAGVLAYLGASIVTARIHIVGNAALMSVGIQDIAGNSFEGEQQRLTKLPELLAKAEAGALDLVRELPKRRKLGRGRDVSVTPGVFIDNQASSDASVIEVNARDRLGLLYDILGGLQDCQLQLVSAQLATYGTKAVDVFYVKDAYGHKLVHTARLADVQRQLLAVCATPVQDSAA